MTVKWTFEDEVTSEVWTFVRNPFEMDSPAMSRRTVGAPKGLAMRRGTIPFPWSFKGYIHTEAEYQVFLDWANRGNAIRISDHLGRIHRVIPQQFDPTPRRSRVDRHWRFTYTFKALYLERVA